jgi:hypothetical protein
MNVRIVTQFALTTLPGGEKVSHNKTMLDLALHIHVVGGGARWLHGQCARRAIAEAKQCSQ